MKLIKKLRKGFTLIELVVVIAVIAILAAISVISYLSITNKAKESNDHMVIDQVNTLVQSTSYQSRKATVHDLVSELDQTDGFDMRKIQPELQGTEFVYCFDENMFGYWKDEKVVYPKKLVDKLGSNYAKSDVWFFRDKVDPSEEHSIYLKATPAEKRVATRGGLDVGDQKDIEAITLERPASIGSAGGDLVIRTNSASTSLTIDAATDTVKHYGAIGSLNIIAVANASYHEFGQVAFAEIATGRIVLESDSAVEHIHLTATEGNFNDITVAKASDVEMPDFSRDPVDIPAEGKLVVALQDGTDKDDEKDYVWLTAVGIYEQVTVSDSKIEAGNNYAADSNDQEKKDTAQQIANNITFSEGGEDYKVTAKTTDGGATWTYEVVDQTGTVSEDYSAVKDSAENTVNVQTTGGTPEVVETTKENGITSAEKTEKQTELINEAKAPEVAKEYAENGDALIFNLTTGVYYNDLYTALDEVPASTKTTLILLKDITGVSNKNYVVKANQIIVFDLNGCKFNTVAPDGSTAYAIENLGTLTIKDNTDKNKDGTGRGKLEMDALDPDLQSIPGYASNVITNRGTLVIESGWIHNASSDGSAAFAIDNDSRATGTNNKLVVNGGKITTTAASSIRQCVLTGSTSDVIINGGVVGSYWIQNYGTENATANGRLVINDVEALYNFNFDLGYSIDRGYGLIGSNVIVKINGGNFKGLSVKANNTSVTNFLYGGTFSTKVKLNGDGVAYTINGGTFNDDILCEGTLARNGGTYNASVKENYATLRVWFGSSYITDAIVGEDYTIDTGYDLTGKVVSAQYYGGDSEAIDSSKITVNGSKITIDKTALHKFTGQQFCIWVSVSDAE